jgi:predicted nuclease of predicted toxin-antitoxin system
MIDQFSTVLLDMNDTFMFGADRFSPDEDYSLIYHQLGGTMEPSLANQLIQAAYNYLDIRYPDPQYRETFPSLRQASLSVEDGDSLSEEDLDLLTETFAHYAQEQKYTIVTKDADYSELGLMRGFPPKVIWIRRGNCKTADIEALLRNHYSALVAMEVSSTTGILTLF